MTLMHECDNCKCPDERVFRDSFTGLSLCPMCLYPIIGKLSTCPGTEGDNLRQLLEQQGDTYTENDNDNCFYNDPNR